MRIRATSISVLAMLALVGAHERLLENQFGRLRDLIQGPDGFLYFSTSNRDGRGNPGPEDDRILRIVPK